MAVGDTYILDEKQGKSLNRIDTKTNWEAVNPVLAIGEMGIEKDGLLQNIKVGDGVTPWNSLQYMFKSCPYEVGDILVTMNETDPALRWPGTTWVVFAPGRVLIGAGKGTDINGTSMEFKVGATGGEYSHQLTVGEMPSHNHWITPNVAQWAAASSRNSSNQSIAPQMKVGESGLASGQDGCFFADRLIDSLRYTSTNGSTQKHQIIQPFSACFLYKRIS